MYESDEDLVDVEELIKYTEKQRMLQQCRDILEAPKKEDDGTSTFGIRKDPHSDPKRRSSRGRGGSRGREGRRGGEYPAAEDETYGSAYDQLATIGRSAVIVPRDGNCMFMSVALQIAEPNMTHNYLRKLTVEFGRRNADEFCKFTKQSRWGYLKDLQKLEKDKVWNVETGDLAIAILQRALRRRIVVIRSNSVAHHFPDDGSLIDDNSIVIVQDDTQNHYDGSKLLRRLPPISPVELTERSHVFQSAVVKLANIRRKLVVMPPDGNCFFKSVSFQLDGSFLLTHCYLRDVVFCLGKQNADEFCQFTAGSHQQYMKDMKELSVDKAWNDELADVVITILQRYLEKKIVIIQNNAVDRHFPHDGKPISHDDIVIVRDDFHTHYNGTEYIIQEDEPTRPASTVGEGYQSAWWQLDNIGMRIDQVPDTGNSLFVCIDRQLGRPDLNPSKLRRMASDVAWKYSKSNCQFTSELKKLHKDEYWSAKISDIVIAALAKALKIKIIVVRDYQKPLHFPDDGKTLEEMDTHDTCVVVHNQDHNLRHYDSTTDENPHDNEPNLPFKPTDRKYSSMRSIARSVSSSSIGRLFRSRLSLPRSKRSTPSQPSSPTRSQQLLSSSSRSSSLARSQRLTPFHSQPSSPTGSRAQSSDVQQIESSHGEDVYEVPISRPPKLPIKISVQVTGDDVPPPLPPRNPSQKRPVQPQPSPPVWSKPFPGYDVTIPKSSQPKVRTGVNVEVVGKVPTPLLACDPFRKQKHKPSTPILSRPFSFYDNYTAPVRHNVPSAVNVQPGEVPPQLPARKPVLTHPVRIKPPPSMSRPFPTTLYGSDSSSPAPPVPSRAGRKPLQTERKALSYPFYENVGDWI